MQAFKLTRKEKIEAILSTIVMVAAPVLFFGAIVLASVK